MSISTKQFILGLVQMALIVFSAHALFSGTSFPAIHVGAIAVNLILGAFNLISGLTHD